MHGFKEFDIRIAAIAPPRDGAGPRLLSLHILTSVFVEKTQDNNTSIDLGSQSLRFDG